MKNAILRISFLLLFLPGVVWAQPGVLRVVNTDNYFWGDWGWHGGGVNDFAVDASANVYTCADSRIYMIAPSGSIDTIAGTDDWTSTFLGDGGPATNVYIGFGHTQTGKIALDKRGNLYIVDAGRYRVRKVDTGGIITTIAGTGELGFSGDGGAATLAKLSPQCVTVDRWGNIYVGDSYRIRKIDTFGIITTVAGNGAYGPISDGAPATAGPIREPSDIAVDGAGNIFFQNDSFVCKVSSAGLLQKVTWSSRWWFDSSSGEGGPATAAYTGSVQGIDADAAGNVYLASGYCRVIRKINTSGIITTIAGIVPTDFDETCYPMQNGALADTSKLCRPGGVAVSASGDVYFANQGQSQLWKVVYAPTISSDSFSIFLAKTCLGADFYIRKELFVPGQSVKTLYGDGSEITNAIESSDDGSGSASIGHVFVSPGYYSVKHILYDGSLAIDSISYTHHFQFCNNVYGRFYYDDNGNCSYDSVTERYSHTPIVIRVDSNDVPVDTIATVAGFYYKAYGNPGDVYSFRLLSASDSVLVACPSSGVLTKTITSAVDDGETIYFPLSCSPASGYDLACVSTANAGRHTQIFDIWYKNKSCTSTDATLTVHFSSKYDFLGAIPAPASVSGNVATWNFTALSSMMPYGHILLHLERNATLPWLLPGDTVNTRIIITPNTGDVDTNNNVVIRCDTVKSSWDPNEILVSPAGNILNGTELEYTVHFENMGNDTAHNVHVMDTLSNDVDLSTLRIVMSSAVMNTVYIREGGYNVVKFDFPNIKLLDSSQNAFNDGMVIYTVKTKTGLPHGTPITNRAGIYFDENEVVMTNTAVNHILVPTINVSPASSTICHTDTARFTATAISLKQPYYHWLVNGVHVGGNSPTYEATGLANGSVVKCLLYNPAHDTVISESNAVVLTVETAPVAGSITGANAVCESGTMMLTASVPGGAWSASAGATVAGGVVTGAAAGISTISYAVTNSCATAVTTKNITVNPLPAAGMITAASIVCPGATAPLASSVPGGAWYVTGGHATLSGSVLTGTSAGTATVSYMVTNGCGTAVATHIMTVNPLPVAGSISGASAVCVGSMASLTASVPGGVWSAGAGAGVSAGSVLGLTAGATTISYSVTNICGTAVAVHSMTVNPLPAAGSITGAGVVCEGAAETLTASTASGAWSVSSSAASVSGGVVTGLAAGSVTISYTVNNSCGTDIATHTMTVNPAPVAGSITGAATVCEGATTTLTAGVPGGVWSAAGGGSVTGGVVTGVAAGTTTISYSVTNSCGTAVANHSMTVNPLPVAGSLTGAATVCVGNTEALTASVPGGAWSSSTGTTVIGGVVTGVSAGAATVSYAVTNGCGTDVATHPMMVVAPPVAGVITGATTVCENAQETLTGSVPGGAWSATNSNVNVSGGVVTGVWAGTTTISYTVTNACGVAVATHSMTVNPLPQAGSISGAATLCVGRQATITATVAGGVWSMSSGYASVINGIVTGIAAGVSTISYAVTNTCGTATAIHNLTVETVPVVNTTIGPKNVCVEQSVTLVNTTPGGTWEASDDKMTVTAGTVTGVNAGDAAILYRVANACGIGVAVHTMTVTPKPEAGSITGKEQVYTGETIVLTATNPGGVWSSSNSNATVADGVVSGKAAGDVVILYTVTNPCGSDVAQKDVKVLADAGPTLLPNPTRSMLTIRANGRQYHSLQITDAAGRQVYSAEYAGSEVTVDVRMLPAGNYQVKLVGEKSSAVEQFTKL